MNTENTADNSSRRLAFTGYAAFLLSGFCAISAGVVVSILKDKYSLNYSLSGTLLSMMSIGNMLASFAAGILPSKIGRRASVLLMSLGYFIGYLLMAFLGSTGILIGSFILVGIAKGCVINNCTILVGNHAPDRTKGMVLMHAGYATGALVCPFIISALLCINTSAPMIGIAIVGLILWGVFVFAQLPGRSSASAAGSKTKTDFSFIRQGRFWLLTALIFCQNAAETAVTGWLVTYYKDNGILSGHLSTYTVTVMWGATLIGRLLIAFVLRVKDSFKAMAIMGIGCTVFYALMIGADTPAAAIILLFAFAASMAGINPVGMAGIGKSMTGESVGVLLPIAGLGQIVMPWIIGIVADRIGLNAAMLLDLIPCAGIVALSLIIKFTDSHRQDI